MFSLEWISRKVALKANNGKYICTKKNGQLLAVSDSAGDTGICSCALQPFSSPTHQTFTLPSFPSGEDDLLSLKLINRPMLILRGEHGFICHHRNGNTLDANRSIYDIFTLQFSNGAYHIKGLICVLI